MSSTLWSFTENATAVTSILPTDQPLVYRSGVPTLVTNLGTAHNGIYQAGGATKTLTSADNGKTTFFDTAAGTVITLPAATGTGNKYKFLITVIATSNSHIVKVANATDFFVGAIWGVSDDPATVKGWIAANSGTVSTNSDTVTLNRTTTGSVTVGEWIEIEDVATATFAIRGLITQTGTEATPFSAGV